MTGYKTYTGLIMLLLGILGISDYITPDEVEILVFNIGQIIDLSLQTSGIIVAVIGAIHKDIRLKKPV